MGNRRKTMKMHCFSVLALTGAKNKDQGSGVTERGIGNNAVE
jgi:hypothetical protein